jgi:predicted O-methyltransferase YrrM
MVLDYPVSPRPRYDIAHPHPQLHKIIADRSDIYARQLAGFLDLTPDLVRIPQSIPQGGSGPSWLNPYQPMLDAVALYCFVATTNPRLYLEVGSGYSTGFVRRAILDHHLRTKIVSIDPNPRAEIDALCDRVIRSPLESCDLAIADQLREGDILFVDSSHRCYMNSDVTVLFLEVLPKLRPGILVQVHDIFLPYDYPQDWIERYYAEQYLLACYLLAGFPKFEIALPNFFVANDPRLSAVLAPLWAEMKAVGSHGFGFWLRTVGSAVEAPSEPN